MPPPRTTVRGFTLIELMVVIAIIVLAAGMMTPTITDFFRNRQLESLRGHFGSAFNSARLDAVNKGRRVSIVFFREGVREYDEKDKTFTDEFNPDTAPGGDEKVWFILGFLGGKSSTTLPKYRDWEPSHVTAAGIAGGPSGSGKAEAGDLKQYNVSGLPKITFERDGSLHFAAGADVSSKSFRQDIPEISDIMVFQDGSKTGCFIDLRPPGQFRGKIVPMLDIPTRPPVEDEKVPEIEMRDVSSSEEEGGGEEP